MRIKFTFHFMSIYFKIYNFTECISRNGTEIKIYFTNCIKRLLSYISAYSNFLRVLKNPRYTSSVKNFSFCSSKFVLREVQHLTLEPRLSAFKICFHNANSDTYQTRVNVVVSQSLGGQITIVKQRRCLWWTRRERTRIRDEHRG